MKNRREDRVKEIFRTPEDWMDCCRYLVKVLSAVLDGKTAPPLPEGRTWEQVFEMSKYHGLESMAFVGVQELLEKDENLYQEWEKCYAANISRCFTQEEELKKIVHELTASGIDVLLLKGCLIRDLYPERDYRQMVDVDMLIREEDRLTAGEILRKIGYTYIPDPHDHHDSYFKPPYMTVELHRNLVQENCNYTEYGKDIWERVIPVSGRKGCFQMNINDYYVFHLIHFAKHYYASGSGIRSILDIYLYLRKYGRELDGKYLEGWMKKLELQELRESVERLSEYWFSAAGGEIPQMMRDVEKKVFLSGVHGSWLQVVLRKAEECRSQRKSVVSYILGRIFMNREKMAERYPFLNKYPVLLPLCWVHRLAKAVLLNRKTIQYELGTLLKKVK